MAGLGVSAQNKKWQAEDDARTMARAAEVNSNTKRLAAAKKAAVVMATEKQKELTAMRKVASPSRVSTKPTTTRKL